MPYTKTTWADEVPASLPIKYAIEDDTAGEVATSATIALVTSVTAGTPVNAANLNKIETGIETAQAAAEAAVPKSLFTAIGDLLYATAAGVVARLAKPTATGLLSMTSTGTPSWRDETRYTFPVGAIFISTVSTNPGTTLGYGTWVAFGEGRVLVGIDATQTEFDTGGETGGSKTHTLTTAEIPSHRHQLDDTSTHNVASGTGSEAENNVVSGTNEYSLYEGGGGAHNNLQPYVVVYMWRRNS